jgi:hypothetical protein
MCYDRQHRLERARCVVYRLHFFATTGEDSGQAAINRLLDELAAADRPVLGEWRGPFVEEVAAYRLATPNSDGSAAADWLTLEVHAGVEFNADMVTGIDPDAEHAIWGSDLHVEVSLSGADPDWELVDRIWTTLERLWSAIAWDEQSRFEISRQIPS